ncbi:MAG: protein kinase [Myxococcales bacterium]|nr:protein kinase [Myxococcales bacterium]
MVAPTGRRLGRYHLVEPIGAGPCGEVFRAKVVGVAGMERQFAIKRFYPTVLARPEANARLQQATRTYGGLDHPRIARLAELGVASGSTFTATELVVGLDIGRLAEMAANDRDRVPAGAALALVSAAARAIGYAHGRGVSHGGLCPTNLIATLDGDVKVTDFGIISCRLGPRPAADETLVARIPYLAPEQLLGEAVAAAADVFALGVIAYELVSGVRPFVGGSAAEIEHAIVSGRPAQLELPRPIARVIDRCLARSPFERFPDARSLADALDAALRLSPLSGSRQDLATRVRTATEHLTRLNEQQLSGALNFSVPMPQRGNVGALPLPPPTSAPPTPPPTPPPLPARPFRAGAVPPLRVPPTEPGDEITRARDGAPSHVELSIGDETAPRIEPLWPPTEPVQLLRGPAPMLAPPRVAPAPPPRVAPPSQPPPTTLPPPTLPPPMGEPPPRARPQSSHPPMAMVPMTGPPPLRVAAPPARRRRPWAIAAVALVAIAGGGAALVATRERGSATPDPGPTVARVDAGAPGPDADAIAIAPTAPVDGAVIALAPPPPDAAAAAPPPDAAAADAAAGVPPPPSDKVVITSTPPGAMVYLDGADQGVTPLTLAATADEHALAVFAPGHDLYLATIDGSGVHDAALTALAPRTGRGGIKVRCKAKRRYYVFIDGEPTGELCPTERVPVDLGTHTVEVYDLLTETRRSSSVRVVQISRSTRIKMD